MSRLTNLKIRKVFKGKSGEGEYGPWQAWNMYFDGNEEHKDTKFGYFSGGNKPAPREGMVVDLIEFETKEKGGYENRVITKLLPAEIQPDPETSTTGNSRNSPNGGQTRMSMYVSYAKDILVAKIAAGGSAKNSRIMSMGLTEICEIVARAGKRMCDIAENGAGEEQPDEEPKQEPEKDNVPEGEEDVPF